MSLPVPPVIYVHMSAAFAALVVGAWQLARPKGTSSHRAIGWTWMRGLHIGGLIIAGLFTFMPGRLLGNLVWKGCWGC